VQVSSTESVSMSIAEVAKLVGISESLARQLARENRFPGAFRLGWLLWDECSACGAVRTDRAVSAAQIRGWWADPSRCDEL
jgi:predicted DNA-binding transcriptional regulator AlpA